MNKMFGFASRSAALAGVDTAAQSRVKKKAKARQQLLIAAFLRLVAVASW